MAGGALITPFEKAANVSNRQYSRRLERAVTDFGAESPFAKVGDRIKIHYGEGVYVPPSAARSITEKHAHQIKELQAHRIPPSRLKSGPNFIVAEMDGTMIPQVQTTSGTADARKTRKVYWSEARMSLAYKADDHSSVSYAGTMGDTDSAGNNLNYCVRSIGYGAKTRIHGLGDGATWIAEQFELKFGSDAEYLLDFYHASQYLAAAATCFPEYDQKDWLSLNQAHLKNGAIDLVIQPLHEHVEAKNCGQASCAAEKCHNYLIRRTHQLGYAAALKNNLPIGSGAIESAHKHILQLRLKRPGAWWKRYNAEAMIALRVERANDEWDHYWETTPTHLSRVPSLDQILTMHLR